MEFKIYRSKIDGDIRLYHETLIKYHVRYMSEVVSKYYGGKEVKFVKEAVIIINSLEELLSLERELETGLILYKNELEIYDSERE